MKFMKGVMIGTLISAGVVIMYADSMNMSKRKVMKKGKQMAKKIGII